MRPFPYVIGLTGGIACGKSTASHLFKQLGADIIDADNMTRTLTQINEPAYLKIIKHFGNAILLPDQTLNRKKLRDIIFANPYEKQWLEQLLHPLVWEKMHTLITQSPAPYVLVVVPLLFETHVPSWIKKIIVVSVSKKNQIKRLMKRDHIDTALAEKILAAQLSSEEKCRLSDYIIDNNEDELNLKKQITHLHDVFLRCAQPNKP